MNIDIEATGYIVSCDTCKYGYLRKESMKEPCMYCTGHSHFERKQDNADNDWQGMNVKDVKK